MANKKGHRRFGNIRKLPSGRYQARYVGPDGIERKAPNTFADEKRAEKWLTVIESEIIKGEWEPPEPSEITLADYGKRWIKERTLAPRTRENYEDLFRLHIEPHLGRLSLSVIKPSTIRSWRSKLLEISTPEPQAVKAYALLRAIFNTAIKPDKILRENPCQIEGYDKYHTPERTPATAEQVMKLAQRMPQRFSALVIVAGFSSLRWGELVALRRCDIDLDAGAVRVPRKLAALRSRLEFGPPKSEAGKRRVFLPAVAVDALRAHLREYVSADLEAIVFTGPKGALLRSGNFLRAARWSQVRVELGLPDGFTFHDLRHTGNTLAASTGASTRELMRRMGHSSMRAALIYQHSSDERDREIAEGITRRLTNRPRKAEGKKQQKRRQDPQEGSTGA